MFGDFLGPTNFISLKNGDITFTSPMPGGRLAKVSENNVAMPFNRFYANYNHFHNASELTRTDCFCNPTTESRHINRATFGLERRIGDNWSCEFRLPFTGNRDFAVPSTTPFVEDAFFEVSDVGNFSMIAKRMLAATDRSVISGGLGIIVPTGGDFRILVPNPIASPAIREYAVRNNAIHLLPFVAMQRTNEHFFVNAFAQLDLDVNGNRIEFLADGPPLAGGVVQDQTLLFLDVSIGRWFYENRRASFIKGLAGIFEFHYSTALENADVFFGPGSSSFGNANNRFDVVNVSTLIHMDLAERIRLRIGAVFPLGNGPNHRFFDAEAMIQITFRPL